MSALSLTKSVYEAIRAHGEETYPHECCGALLGRPGEHGWLVTDSVRAGNTRTDSAHNRYQIAPIELVRIQRQARENALEIAGFYHSHPDHPAHPSQFDREHAWPWYSYIIVSVMSGKPADMTSWRLNDDRQDYTPERIETRNRTAV